MKTQSTALYVLRLAVTLLLITGVMAALLAGINVITKPIIEKLQAEKTQQAIEAVLPGGGEEVEFDASANPNVAAVYASDTGYAVKVTPSGFDGTITMMVGIDKEGNVLGISIISHTETAGLGAVAAAKNSKGEAFRNSFVGLSGTVLTEKDGGEADTITGATITSRAVAKGVTDALTCVAGLS